MKRSSVAVLLSSARMLLLSSCPPLDETNPYASSGPKMAELQPLKQSVDTRVAWRESVGKSDA